MKPPEESASGVPEEKKMKPTVIGSSVQPTDTGSGSRPTVIRGQTPPVTASPMASGIQSSGGMRPTKIGGGAPAPQPTSAPIPPPSPSKPSVMSTPPPPQMVRPSAPTALGTVRKRIPVTFDDVRRQNQHTDQKVLEAALTTILTTNVDELDDNRCILWGKKPQQEYADCVQENLRLSQAKEFGDVLRLLTRLQTLLSEIDFERLLGLGKGFFSKLTRDSEEKRLKFFDHTQSEINQIINLLSNKDQVLLDHQDKVQALIVRIRSAANDIEAHSIAAYFLAEYLRREYSSAPEKSRLVPLLEQRSMSLTQTLGQIRGNAPLLQQQEEQPLQIITNIQSVVLVQVPDWLGSFASLRSVVEGNKQTNPTEVDEISRKRTVIVSELKVK